MTKAEHQTIERFGRGWLSAVQALRAESLAAQALLVDHQSQSRSGGCCI
jgi:hypothetical protein